MRTIGIIGSGTAGLQLAYALKDDFDVTVLHHEEPDEVRSGRVRSTQVHFQPTLARERRVHMPANSDAPQIRTIHFQLGGQKLFTGQLTGIATSTDQRIRFADAMEDLAKDGVRFRHGRIAAGDLDALAASFDLIIDAAGKSGPVASFPVDESLTPFRTPQRKCIVGYFSGIRPVEPEGISITVMPGTGEMFEIPAVTSNGRATILFIEAVPGGALDAFVGVKGPDAFAERMLGVVEEHFPEIAGRIDPAKFALIDDNAYLLTAVTPAVHRPYVMHNGTLILGCGDSVFLADPITGQGCNTASYAAEQLYETLLAHADADWDESIGSEYWNRTQPYIKAVTEWTNAMTQPLPGHIAELLMQAAADQNTADRIAHWFEDPTQAYRSFFEQHNSQPFPR